MNLALVMDMVQARALPPRAGALAICGVGLLGRITSEAPEPVVYADGNTGLAWKGVQLTHAEFVSPFTSDRIVVVPGGPWSSRNPIVLGYE